MVDGDSCIEVLQNHGVLNLKRFPDSKSLAVAAARQDVRVFCNDKPPAVYYLNKLGVENDIALLNYLSSVTLSPADKD